MKIILNGEDVELREETTVEALLSLHPPAHKGFAVEVNREVVPRSGHTRCVLTEGDMVEIVTLVGGG